MAGISNDNDFEGAVAVADVGVPDAYGQAALLLVESLIHKLVEHSVISLTDAIEVIDVANEVKHEIGADLGDTPTTMAKSLSLLSTIRKSLQLDLPQ